ncbi:MAG: LysR substrate-binding domain-containing protein [Pseudomonadota bacterium]
MNLKQMAVFREVILTGSVSEAARNLNRTQPSVSHMIATLEEELGMKLFERRRGRLHPVPEAQYLFKECDEVLTRVNSVSQNMKRMKAMDQGELRLISMPGPAAVLLPDLISTHVGPHPEINVTLLSRSSDAVVQLVGSQQFDIGVADHDPARDIEATLIQARTYQFNCVCAVPAGSPLAARGSVGPADLNGVPMAALFPEHRSFQSTRRIFEAAEARLHVRFVGQFFVPLLVYVERGLACALVDPLTAESWQRMAADPALIRFLPFSPPVGFGVDLLTPAYRPSSLVAKSFAGRLVRLMTDLGGQAQSSSRPPSQTRASASAATAARRAEPSARP